ncbi:MAG TPA: sigma-70 family RNA polymerase sigma factor [Burkholderiales bacterium]|nr:sigma-70 family RNA polymerase sigma factor [Burkholderiales bacterium]
MVIGAALQGNHFSGAPGDRAEFPSAPVPHPAGSAALHPTIPGSIAMAPNDELLELEKLLVEQLRGIIARSEQALAGFYDATSGRVYGLALRITGRSDAAEEVTTDVYMQVWRDASRYDLGRGRVLTWLLTICRSRAIDSIRRRDAAEPCAEPEELAAQDDGGAGSPEALLLLAERNEALRKALQTLDPLQRQLLSLAFFRGLTHEEIAGHADLPLGSVKTHIRRALQQLQSQLGSLLPAGWR